MVISSIPCLGISVKEIFRMYKYVVLPFIFLTFFSCPPIESAVKDAGKNEPINNDLFQKPSFSQIEILSADFGLFNMSESGEPRFQPTLKVPFKENQSYGWIILLKTKKKRIKWREEFELPVAPKTWDDVKKPGRRTISKDRRVAITEIEVTPAGGLILNAWTIDPGDPAGKYIIRIYIENEHVRTFEFDVQ